MPDIYIAKDKKPQASSSHEPGQAVNTNDRQPLAKKSAPPTPGQKLKAVLSKEINQITDSGQPKTSSNPLVSFAFYPTRTRFETQSEEEKIILLLRRHFITNLPWIFLAILLLVAPTFLRFLPLPPILPPRFQLVALMIWYLVTLAFIFENFLSWFFNINLITDERVIDFDFSNLVYKDISDAQISKVQDVRVAVGGVIRTFFNYGDVFIQTAAELPNFHFMAVPNPEQVSKLIDKLRLEEEQEQLEGRAR